jgi:hypothetical protein
MKRHTATIYKLLYYSIQHRGFVYQNEIEDNARVIMSSRNRPSSAHIFDHRQSTTPTQRVRPKTANNYAKHEQPSMLRPQHLSKNQHSYYGPSTSVARPTSAVERTEMYKRLLVDSVSKIHCPTLYRALCKIEKAFRDNRKARYACAKMLYLAAVRGDYDYDDIQVHLRNHLNIYVSSAESRQLVLYGGLFSNQNMGNTKSVIEDIKAASDVDAAEAAATTAANAFQEDMRLCVKGMQLSVPPLYCYTKWCKDVKKMESQRHLSSGFFSGSKKHFANRIGMAGTAYEGSDCGGSVTSFEEVMAGDLAGMLSSSSLISHSRGGGSAVKSTGSDDDEDDYAPLPVQKKPVKVNKFKRIAFGIMLALPGDEADIPENTSPKTRKKGMQYLYQSSVAGPTSPEKLRMIASLIRGEVPLKDKDKQKTGVPPSPQEPSTATATGSGGDDDEEERRPRIGGLGIVASDEIAAGYFTGPRSPPLKNSIPMPGDTSAPGSPPPKRGAASLRKARSHLDPPVSDLMSISGTQSLDSHEGSLSPGDSRRESACGGIAVLKDRVVVDSVPASPIASPAQAINRKTIIAGATARLRQVTIMESSVYCPPVPSQESQIKQSSHVGLAKIRMLSKSSSFNGKQSGSFESMGGVAKPAEEKEDERDAVALEIPSRDASPLPASPAGGKRKSPLRPTMALPRSMSSNSLLGKNKGGSTFSDDDFVSSPTLNVLNGFSLPFAG